MAATVALAWAEERNKRGLTTMSALTVSLYGCQPAPGHRPSRGPVRTLTVKLSQVLLIHFNSEPVVFGPSKPLHPDPFAAAYFRGSNLWAFADLYRGAHQRRKTKRQRCVVSSPSPFDSSYCQKWCLGD